MEALDIKKKQDIESARVKLDDTKQKLTETLNRISKLESEHQEAKLQRNRKIASLQNMDANHLLKMSKLTGDVESLSKVLEARKEEEEALKKTNVDLKEELARCEEATVNMEKEFVLEIEDLQRKINLGYVQLRTDKDEEVLLEVGMASIKDEGQVPFVEEVLKKRRDARRARQEELDAELGTLEESQKRAEKQIKHKIQEMAASKAKYAALFKEYTLVKKAKRGM